MLQFIQRYQKSMIAAFGLLTGLAMITSSLRVLDQSAPQRSESRCIELDTGAIVPKATFEALYRLLSHESSLDPGVSPWCRPNELNRGIITANIIDLGLGEVVAASAADRIQPQWHKIMERQRDWCKQGHTAEMVALLKQEAPDLLTATASAGAIDPAKFLEMQRKGYFLAQKIPSSALLLWLNKVKSGEAQLEQGFDPEEVRLFGARTLVDWYGEDFLKQCVTLIISAARKASASGLSVSRLEVLEDWRRQLKEGGVSAAMLDKQIDSILRGRQISRAAAEDAWAQVLLFQKWLALECDQLIKQDGALQERVAKAIADFEASTQVRCLKSRIELPNMEHLFAFESYLQGVSERRENPLMLPETMLDIAKIQRRAPELLVQPVMLRYRAIDLNAIRGKIPLSAIGQWQLSDSGWQQLCSRCRSLHGQQEATNRGTLIEGLPAAEEMLADRLARDALMQNRSALIERAWANARLQEKSYRVSLANLDGPLEQGPTAPQYLEWAMSSEPPAEFGGKRWRYRLESICKVGLPEPLTYQESLENGGLNLLLTRLLHSDYDIMMKSGSALLWNGEQPRTFKNMEPLLIEQRLAGVLSAIESMAKERDIVLPKDRNEWGVIRMALALQQQIADPFLAQQFQAEETIETVTNYRYPMIAKLACGEWSLPMLNQGKAEIMEVKAHIAGEERIDVKHPVTHKCLRNELQARVATFLGEARCK